MKKGNTKKTQGIVLGSVAAVFVALIAAVAIMSKLGVFEGDSKAEASSDDIVSEKEQSTIVDGVEMEEGELSIEDVLTQATGYDGIYNKIVSCYETLYTEDSLSDFSMTEDYLVSEEDLEAYEGEVYDMAKMISFTEMPEYEESSGNVCKTDGTYAYMVRNDGFLRIMKLDGSTMEHMSIISEYEHEMEFIMDFHVAGSQLVLITSYTEILDETLGTYAEGTMIYTYDITDPVYPVRMGTVELEGYYMGSRVIDADVYVYTNCYKGDYIAEDGSMIPMEQLEASAYVPTVNGEALPAESVYLPAGVSDTAYFICASVNLENPEQAKDTKAFLSVDSQYYAGKNGIYLTLKNGMYNIKDTMIARLEFADGMITPAAAGAVEGYIMGTMCMSEQDGGLRVVSTVNSDEESVNRLYMMDNQFQIISKKEDLAAGEQIQSVRFIGDKLYLATYGDNPIVVADLSDGDAVSEVSLQKVNGFDGLFYEFGNDQILGVNYILNQETLVFEGIRLTMFEVSKDAIQELHSVEIMADSTPAISDVTGLFVDVEHGLIGFPTEDWDETYINVENFYRLFSYTVENGFQTVLEARLGGGSCWYTRGFVAGETFYVAEQDSGNIRSFDMVNGYDQTGEMYY